MQLNYRFVFTNGNGPFRKHFSADELGRLSLIMLFQLNCRLINQGFALLLGIFETAIAMTIYYFILVILGIVAAIFLHAKRYLHVTFRLFIVSLVLQFVYFILYLSEYAQFSSSGMSTPGLLTAGTFSDGVLA